MKVITFLIIIVGLSVTGLVSAKKESNKLIEDTTKCDKLCNDQSDSTLHNDDHDFSSSSTREGSDGDEQTSRRCYIELSRQTKGTKIKKLGILNQKQAQQKASQPSEQSKCNVTSIGSSYPMVKNYKETLILKTNNDSKLHGSTRAPINNSIAGFIRESESYLGQENIRGGNDQKVVRNMTTKSAMEEEVFNPKRTSHQQVILKASKKGVLDDCIDAHNYYRQRHNAPKLVQDVKIVRFAEVRARQIVHHFDHLNNLPYGENLAMTSAQGVTCASLVKMWYNEKNLYDYATGGFSHQTGHFTQLVWKGTKRVGCGYKTGPSGTYLACNYDPPGNYEGAYRKNVAPDTRA